MPRPSTTKIHLKITYRSKIPLKFPRGQWVKTPSIEWTWLILSHQGQVTHKCVSEPGHYRWFRYWLVAFSASGYCVNLLYLVRHVGANLNKVWIKIQQYWYWKFNLNTRILRNDSHFVQGSTVLTHCGPRRHLVTDNLVNISSGHGSLSDDTKPLPEAMLTNHHRGTPAFTWGQFHRECSVYIYIWCISFENQKTLGSNELPSSL